MSDLGSDEKISVSASQDLAYEKSMAPLDEVWVLQWSYADKIVVRMLSNRKHGTRVAFKIQQ